MLQVNDEMNSIAFIVFQAIAMSFQPKSHSTISSALKVRIQTLAITTERSVDITSATISCKQVV